jgi:hypothetical protein
MSSNKKTAIQYIRGPVDNLTQARNPDYLELRQTNPFHHDCHDTLFHFADAQMRRI